MILRRTLPALSLALLLSACANLDQPAKLNAPASISFDGAVFLPAHTSSNPQQAIWEYTADGESVNNWQWTRLLTINEIYMPVSLNRWTQATIQSLQSEKPVPHYEVQPVGADEVHIKIIYEPKPNVAHLNQYESDVWIARSACGGIVNLQFARQYAVVPNEDRQARMAQIAQDNTRDMQRLQALNWTPECASH